MKKCNKCDIEKKESEFTSNKYTCKECRNDKRRKNTQRFAPKFYIKKGCNECKESKQGTEFSTCKENTDGLRGVCKECTTWRVKKTKYGIGKKEYHSMLKEQKGCCKICKTEKYSKLGQDHNHFAIDHCHTTGKVRGLLCDACNKALGLLEDNTEYIENALNYIQEQGDALSLTLL